FRIEVCAETQRPISNVGKYPHRRKIGCRSAMPFGALPRYPNMSRRPSRLRPACLDRLPCAVRCARLCTDSGLSAVLSADQGLLQWRAARRLGDVGLAEHAVQETLLRAWRS